VIDNAIGSERQAALETMKAWREARNAHMPGSKAYRTLDEEYRKAEAAYQNLGR
jgi:hypothetical protein